MGLYCNQCFPRISLGAHNGYHHHCFISFYLFNLTYLYKLSAFFEMLRRCYIARFGETLTLILSADIITLAVLITLCLCDVLIASCGCLFCCCMCYRNRSKNNNSYQLNNVQRSSITYPKISRLSRVSSSTAGGVEMEWVETQRYSQSSDIPLHQSTGNALPCAICI